MSMNDDTTDEVTRLMRANLLEVFNEPDPRRRAAAIDRTYAASVKWSDDDGVTVGRDELAKKAEALRAGLDGLEFSAAGPVHQTSGLGYLGWELAPTGADSAVVTGFDVALIADGRITDLYTVITRHAD
jgi:hypothetical protein